MTLIGLPVLCFSETVWRFMGLQQDLGVQRDLSHEALVLQLKLGFHVGQGDALL